MLEDELFVSLLDRKIEGVGNDNEGFYFILDDGRTIWIWMDDDGEMCIGSNMEMDS